MKFEIFLRKNKSIPFIVLRGGGWGRGGMTLAPAGGQSVNFE